MLADEPEADSHPVANRRTHRLGNTDTARRRQTFEACRYIDPVTVDVTPILKHVTRVNADPEL